MHCGAERIRERGSRCLLDELLVAALDRAVAIAQVHDALAVPEHLHLDVPPAAHEALEVDARIAERSPRLGDRECELWFELVGVVVTSRIPRPPPPPTALISTRISELRHAVPRLGRIAHARPRAAPEGLRRPRAHAR